MNKVWTLIASIFQLIVGLAGIVSFIIIAISGESIGKWVITLILSIAFVILGILGIATLVSKK